MIENSFQILIETFCENFSYIFFRIIEMLLSLLLFSYAFSVNPQIETYMIPLTRNFQISLLEGSLVFINTDSFTSEDFIFQFKTEEQSESSYFSHSNLQSSNENSVNNTNSSILSPSPNTHLIFEKGLCGDYFTIIPNFKKIKEKLKKNNHSFLKNRKIVNNMKNNMNDKNNASSYQDQFQSDELFNYNLTLHFWRIPDGLCDINTYVIRSNNVMSIVPRSRSFSRFCIFSTINFSQKFNYKFNFHTTGSLLGINSLRSRELSFKLNETLTNIKINNLISSSKYSMLTNNSVSYANISANSTTSSSVNKALSMMDEDNNFVIELFENGNIGSTLIHSSINVEFTHPFLILGSYDDLNIGKLFLKFQSNDIECSAIPIVKYKIGQNDQKIYSKYKRELISKGTTVQIDSSSSSINKIAHKKDDGQNISDEIEYEKASKLKSFFEIIKSKLLLYIYRKKGGNLCESNSNSNSFSFSYSTLFSPLLSLSTVSIELKGWKRIDVKCIEKGNDTDAGFISLVVILVGMVIFVLLNAKKFVIFEFNEINEARTEENEIHLDINDIESENENIES